MDNDNDGTIDFNGDPGCDSWTDDDEHQACNDGIDNDGDTKVDMADPGCSDILDTSEVDDEGRPLSIQATGTINKPKSFLLLLGRQPGLPALRLHPSSFILSPAPCWSGYDSGE